MFRFRVMFPGFNNSAIKRGTLHRALEELLPLPRLPAPRIAPAVEAGYHHNPMILRVEEGIQTTEGVSRFLKQARSDLLPRDDIGWVLLMSSDAVIKLRPLRIRQR
jgi:hypothetical protein